MGVRAGGYASSADACGQNKWLDERIESKVANSFFQGVTSCMARDGLPSSVVVNVGPGSFTGIKLSLAYGRGLQSGDHEIKLYGYDISTLRTFCKRSMPELCEHDWVLPITSKKMLVCSDEKVWAESPSEFSWRKCLVLPAASQQVLDTVYDHKVGTVYPAAEWSQAIAGFWQDAVKSGFAGLDENPKPHYFFGSSAEEHRGIRV
jgi:hypothetical protein